MTALGVQALGVTIGGMVNNDIAARVLGVLALVIVALQALGVRLKVASRCWIIPRTWQAYGGLRFAALFGYNLGLGWKTRVGSNAFWIIVLAGMLVPNLAATVVAFVLFSAIRALPVIGIGAHRRARASSKAAETDSAVYAAGLRAAVRSQEFRFLHELAFVSFAIAFIF